MTQAVKILGGSPHISIPLSLSCRQAPADSRVEYHPLKSKLISCDVIALHVVKSAVDHVFRARHSNMGILQSSSLLYA